MGFIHNEAGPVNRAQDSHVNGDQLIGCQQHMELHRCLFLHKMETRVLMSNFSSVSKPKGLMGLFPPSSCHPFCLIPGTRSQVGKHSPWQQLPLKNDLPSTEIPSCERPSCHHEWRCLQKRIHSLGWWPGCLCHPRKSPHTYLEPTFQTPAPSWWW